MNYRIDGHKLMYHPKEIAKWLDGEDIAPIYVEISPVGFCNHKCSFCALDFDQHNRKLEYEGFSNAIYDMAEVDVKSIMFAGEGEPLLYRDLPKIMELCEFLGIDTALTTNLSINKDLETYVTCCKWIKVSFNGGDRETYKKIHDIDDFCKVRENIKELVNLKKDLGARCTIGVQIVSLPENQDSVFSLARLTKKLGVDYMVIKPYSQHKKTIRKTYAKLYYDYKQEFSKYPHVIFRKEALTKWNKQKKNYTQCYSVPYFWAYIESSGDVYACSCMLGDDKFNLGNIHKQSFKEIWSGQKRKDLIKQMPTFDLSKCRINCRMEFVNEYLSDLKTGVPHQNFL